MATQYFTASSLDGFIAEPEATLSWLLSRRVDPECPMGHAAFLRDVGAMLTGAVTYRWILEHALDDTGRWPYDVPCWVLSHRELPLVGGDVRFARGDVAACHAEALAAAGHRNVWVVGGGDVAGQLADAGLLDEVWLQYAPVTLGAGVPLLPRRLELRLREVTRNADFTCARYEVVR